MKLGIFHKDAKYVHVYVLQHMRTCSTEVMQHLMQML